jgi:[protein-PII] uridylyltransferase
MARVFLSAMPERYLLANEPPRILADATLAARGVRDGACVQVIVVREPYVELGVVAEDAPGLLARIAAALSAARLKVIAAQVYSWLDDEGCSRVLDVFWVQAGTNAEAVVRMVPRVEGELRRLLNGEVEPEELVQKTNSDPAWVRPAPPVPSHVKIDNRGASRHTILEVVTKDRRDLLFWLANSITAEGLTIELAKINTDGDSVADVFYVSDPAGGKVLDPVKLEALQARLLAKVAELEGGAR